MKFITAMKDDIQFSIFFFLDGEKRRSNKKNKSNGYQNRFFNFFTFLRMEHKTIILRERNTHAHTEKKKMWQSFQNHEVKRHI